MSISTLASAQKLARSDTTLPRRWVRIIPVAIVMYTIAFIDRTNISLALPHISRDLHLTPQQAGGIAGIFYWGYWVLQIPGGHIAKHWSAKKFISILLAAWGFCAIGCGLAHTLGQLRLMRLLLGVAEGGVYPATLILLSHWFVRSERARANAFWNLCLPTAVILSSPASGWILDRWNWHVMLIAEGLLPLVWLVVWLVFIQDRPQHARWLAEGDRARLQSALREESRAIEGAGRGETYLGTVLCPQVFLLAATYFCFISGQMGLLFWLPSAMAKAGTRSNLAAGTLFTLPFLVGAASLLLFSRHSDKTRERRKHVAAAMGIGGISLVLAVLLINYSLPLTFALICLSGIGAYGPLGTFWAIPTETMPAKTVGSVIGLVNAIGNLGGYFAPVIVGYLNARTGNFNSGFLLLGAVTCAGAALALCLPEAARAPVAVEA